MPIMLPIFEASNVTLQITVQFYFFNPMNMNSSFHIFCQGSSPKLKKDSDVAFLNRFLSHR